LALTAFVKRTGHLADNPGLYDLLEEQARLEQGLEILSVRPPNVQALAKKAA
jgi:hypothetical protein